MARKMSNYYFEMVNSLSVDGYGSSFANDQSSTVITTTVQGVGFNDLSDPVTDVSITPSLGGPDVPLSFVIDSDTNIDATYTGKIVTFNTLTVTTGSGSASYTNPAPGVGPESFIGSFPTVAIGNDRVTMTDIHGTGGGYFTSQISKVDVLGAGPALIHTYLLTDSEVTLLTNAIRITDSARLNSVQITGLRLYSVGSSPSIVINLSSGSGDQLPLTTT